VLPSISVKRNVTVPSGNETISFPLPVKQKMNGTLAFILYDIYWSRNNDLTR